MHFDVIVINVLPSVIFAMRSKKLMIASNKSRKCFIVLNCINDTKNFDNILNFFVETVQLKSIIVVIASHLNFMF